MNLRVNAVSVIISMLPLVSHRHVEAFYKTNIVNIMQPLEGGLLRRGSDDDITQDMMEKSCHFRLMQISFFVLSLFSPTCRVLSLTLSVRPV